jgi:phosphate transport system protein
MNDLQAHARFDAELGTLCAQVLAMGGLAESQLAQALYAVTRASGETASQVLELERRVNSAEVDIERELWAVIARRQPNARDLRLLIAVSRMVRDLERVGDEAARLARTAHRMLAHGLAGPMSEPLKEIAAIGGLARTQLREALDAFARQDVEQALGVLRSDSAINAGFEHLMRALVVLMGEDPRRIAAGLDLIFVAKAIERVGDHAKGVAEQVIYSVRGTDVRHTPTGEVATLLAT